MTTLYRAVLLGLVASGILAAQELGLESISLMGKYRIDNETYLGDSVVTHGWEHVLLARLNVSSAVKLEIAAAWLDAQQNSIAGIEPMRERIGSASAGVQWRTLSDHLNMRLAGGVDAIVGNKVRPRGEMSLEATAPLAPNRFVQQLKFKTEGWYTHAMFNAAAIANNIASYGYGVNAGWSMGPKMAAAANYRHEFLRPQSVSLDTTLTRATAIGLPVATDTLLLNAKHTFYAYLYRQLGSYLYLGYAFSFNTSRHDRRVITNVEFNEPGLVFGPGGPQPGGGRRYWLFSWAYYPYPTPIELLAHNVTATVAAPLGRRVQLKATGSFPVYSKQKLRMIYTYYEPTPEYLAGTGIVNPYDHDQYEYYTERGTGPFTAAADVSVAIAAGISANAHYDYFGFPYEEWAYFRHNGYSLHTFALTLSKKF